MKNLETIKEVSISREELANLLQAVHQKGAEFRFRATGKSMNPTILNNDILTLSPLRGISPFPGEVVAFRHPRTENLIIHRIIKADKNGFTIKGDCLRISDSNIPLENIIGVVTRVERKGKSIFWPNRFHHPFPARIYFRFKLIYLKIRRRIKDLFHLIFK